MVVVDQTEEGAEQLTLKLDENATYADTNKSVSVSDFAEGDLLIYSLNGEGEVDEVLNVFAKTDLLGSTSFSNLYKTNALADKKWADLLGDSEEEDVNILFGAVVQQKKDSAYYLATDIAEDGSIKFSEAIDLDLTDAKIYVYNYAAREKDHGRILLDEGMMATAVEDEAYAGGDTDSDTYFVNKVAAEDQVYAVARVHGRNNDEVKEIYLIIND